MKLDISGKRFGKWIVISFDHTNSLGQLYWKCKCDCGNEKIVRGSHMKNGTSTSCGCFRLQLFKSKSGNKNHCWKGYGEIPKGYYTQIKRNSKRRNISFEVSIKYIWDLFLNQSRKCALSHLPLSFPTNQRTYNGTASLDRIDSSKGYTEENVQWVHKDINKMKIDIPEFKFIELCQKVSDVSRHL